MKCRNCASEDLNLFVDLKFAPFSNAYLTRNDLVQPEIYYPLRVVLCPNCLLVQTQNYVNPKNVFTETYSYLSSTSKSFVEHAKTYAIKAISDLKLNSNSLVLEIASNDGYLLQHFMNCGVPTLGIEPTLSTANISISKGIPTVSEFFGLETARKIVQKYGKPDLVIANNVLAHVPDINDFCSGLNYLLESENGIATLEFPHLLNLIRLNQFDTIYHEHYSYLSLNSITTILAKHNLRIYDVLEIPTHGGSLRLYVSSDSNPIKSNHESIQNVLKLEAEHDLNSITGYENFNQRIEVLKEEIKDFFYILKKEGMKIYGYGAAAKANTLLNYCGIGEDYISGIFDAAKSKQGKFMPGSHIPILSPNQISEHTFDVLIIFPWNIKNEIVNIPQISSLNNIKFYTLIPEIKLINE